MEETCLRAFTFDPEIADFQVVYGMQMSYFTPLLPSPPFFLVFNNSCKAKKMKEKQANGIYLVLNKAFHNPSQYIYPKWWEYKCQLEWMLPEWA